MKNNFIDRHENAFLVFGFVAIIVLFNGLAYLDVTFWHFYAYNIFGGISFFSGLALIADFGAVVVLAVSLWETTLKYIEWRKPKHE